MERIRGFLNQREILVLLLTLLAVSTALHGYLLTGPISSLQEKRDEEETIILSVHTPYVHFNILCYKTLSHATCEIEPAMNRKE